MESIPILPAWPSWGKGLHLSLGGQSASQTRTIRSGMTLLKPAGLPMTDEQWMQSPYAHPLSLNGGDANGIKSFKGEASARSYLRYRRP